jgi:hypothetical protein
MSVKTVQKISARNTAESLYVERMTQRRVKLTAVFNEKRRAETVLFLTELWKALFLKDKEEKTFSGLGLKRIVKIAATPNERSTILFLFNSRGLHGLYLIIVATKDLKEALLAIK